MLFTGKGKVQRSITLMSFDNHFIIKKHYATPILSHCYFIFAESLLCHYYFDLLPISRKIKYSKINYCKVKTKSN